MFNLATCRHALKHDGSSLLLVDGFSDCSRQFAEQTCALQAGRSPSVFVVLVGVRPSSHLRVKGRAVEEIIRNQVKPGPEYWDRIFVFVPGIILMVL